MARHITKLKIDGYRCLRNFEVSDLADINILVGDNNCGKTSTLEVLNMFSSVNNEVKWLNNNAKRKTLFERLNSCTDLENLFDVNNPRPIEISFNDTIEKQNLICFTSTTENEMLLLKDIKDIDRRAYNRFQIDIKHNLDKDNSQQNIDEFIIKNIKHSMTNIAVNDKNYFADFYEFSTRFSKKDSYIKFYPTVYEYPYKYIQNGFSLSDIIENKSMYNNLITILKTFDSDIAQIFADKDGDQIIYKIASNNNKKSLPISVFGDGLKLALSIFAAIPRAENGLLLIDEFDSSLHTSQIDSVLHAVISTCKRLNIQLFLTTHSLEAIDKVLDVCNDYLDDVRIIRMTKKSIKTHSSVLKGTLADDLRINNDAELR